MISKLNRNQTYSNKILCKLSTDKHLNGRSTRADKTFDVTVGHIEDIIMEDTFQALQNEFMEEHYHHFEDVEENKLVYTDIFTKYTNLIEKHLEECLQKRMPDFSMDQFMSSIQQRKDQIGGDIFDMLLSFTGFLTFKQMFLDYKVDKEGKSVDLGGLVITSLSNEHL
ncbi:ADP-ribosylation factor-like protein 2-binding protein [Xenia sp. Carnegie-2017]|uniref:ADP-ribosylation factor-like protein 2-binding protein n=1 Tax=Xenia sp. Carnegie-2017 TaxID=2897299 RepID=UPI001F03CDB0|nr:ADP-ribosylation factor-like protein 2-binding protein [Xenia sp. Carnegie-2017]